ncbi:MAG: hypothetical protein ACM3JD_15200 [Rudaea sp.]
MTAIGILTAALVLVTLVRAPQRLWELAILTTPFQASTLMEISASSKESGLAPVYLVLAVACLYELSQWLVQRGLPQPILRVSMPALCFLGWGVLTALAIPSCFPGWLVVAPYSIYTLSRIEPSFSNVTHCLYLTLLLASMILLALHVHRHGQQRVQELIRSYRAAVWISAGIIVWHHLSLYFGVPYPSEFLYNHPGVVHYEGNGIRPELALASGILRASGPFSESAIAAAYLGGGFGLLLAELLCGRRCLWPLLKAAILAIVILSVVSTSSIVILAGTVLFFLLTGLRPGRRRQVAGRLVLLSMILLALPLSILVVSPEARDEAELAVNYLLLSKFDSTTDASARSRTVIEENALEVFASSYGIGAGLGSNVAFTAPGYIASSTGIVGLGLCAWFAYRLRKAYRGRLREVADGALIALDIRRLGGAMVALIIAGLAGSHPLLFVPVWYLVLGIMIGGSCSAQLQDQPCAAIHPASYPTPLKPGLLAQD